MKGGLSGRLQDHVPSFSAPAGRGGAALEGPASLTAWSSSLERDGGDSVAAGVACLPRGRPIGTDGVTRLLSLDEGDVRRGRGVRLGWLARSGGVAGLHQPQKGRFSLRRRWHRV
jgi:hypothetical protein